MKTRTLFSFLIFLIAALPVVALGQGTLRGVVTDSLTNEKLVGVNVILVGTGMGNATNIEGEFTITGIPLNVYSLRVSCIGYTPKVIHVDLERTTTRRLDIRLASTVIQGQEVVITGQMRGQVAAMNQQVTSNTIINVVSEEKIQEVPDANAAEAIGRLSGVSLTRSGGEANKIVLRGLSDRFSSITIDGVRIPATDATERGVDLSMISQGSLSGVELYKALTPDKDADAIAGSINLSTRKAPEQRVVRLDLKGSYNQLTNAYGQYDVAVKYSERFFDDILGLQVNGNLEQRNRSNERIDIDYDQGLDNARDYQITDFTLEYTDEIRKRKGATILLDVNTPDGGSVRLSNVFGKTDRDYLVSTRNYPWGDQVFYTARDREQSTNTFNSSLRGDNFVLGGTLNWGISFAQSTSESPFDYLANFFEPSLTDEKTGEPVSGMLPGTAVIKTNPEQFIPFALNNFQTAFLYTAYFRPERNLDKERVISADYTKQYSLGQGIAGELKAGGKYRVKNRSRVREEHYAPYYLGYWQDHYRAPDGTVQPKNFTGTRFQGFYEQFVKSPTSRLVHTADFLDATPLNRNLFGTYLLNPIVNRDALRLWYDLNKTGVDANGIPEYYSNPAIDAENYGITERVGAAYLMNTLNFGPDITLIAGVRVEQESNDYSSKYSPYSIGGFPVPAGVTKDTTATYSETIILPNFHLSLSPFDFLKIRFAAYRALGRPDFDLRLEKYASWTGASNAKTLILGNSQLRAAKAWNYEINTSFYGNTIGLVSLSVFYKDVRDMFHILSGANATGNELLDYFGIGWRTLHVGDYALTVPYNSSKPTKVWGFELEHQINLSFLPGLLKNFVLSYNASLLRSETHLYSTTFDTSYYFLPEFPGIPFPKYSTRLVESKQKLEGQPEFYGNISLGYDIGGFSARISVFHQAEFNSTFSASGRGDQVANRYTRVDLALKQRVSDYLSILLSINNLTGIEERASIVNRVNNYTLLNTSERYGLTADLGVKLEF